MKNILLFFNLEVWIPFFPMRISPFLFPLLWIGARIPDDLPVFGPQSPPFSYTFPRFVKLPLPPNFSSLFAGGLLDFFVSRDPFFT